MAISNVLVHCNNIIYSLDDTTMESITQYLMVNVSNNSQIDDVRVNVLIACSSSECMYNVRHYCILLYKG